MTDLRISIGDPIVKNNPKSAYVVLVELMHGDADAYSTVKFGPFDSTTLKTGNDYQGDLESVLRVIEAAVDHDEEDYHSIPNWEMVGDGWDNDSTTDHQFKAAYCGHQVRYFDGSGQEFAVSYGWASQGA